MKTEALLEKPYSSLTIATGVSRKRSFSGSLSLLHIRMIHGVITNLSWIYTG